MSMEPQLNLKYSEPEREDFQLNLFPPEVPEPNLHLLLEMDAEIARWRRRTFVLTSIFIHILLVLFIAFSPALLRRYNIMRGIPVTPKEETQVTPLFLPPDLQKSLKPPPHARPSDQNRQAEGRAPKIDPNGIRAPYSRGNTPLPEVKRGAPTPPAPPAPQPAPPVQAQQQAPPPPARPEPPAEAQLRMDDVRPPDANANRFHVPSLTPGQVIQQSIQDAARGGYHTDSAGAGGDSNSEFNNLHPNFSTEAPTILSDTRGVDFGPYLARIVMLVKRNWIAIIPESARLGEKGRVGVVFEILKDGSMPQERMVASSGSDPLDRAAVNSIHASAPFPPLPTEFTGEHLVLQFIFLYNEQPR
jgi:TonB family protein